MRSLEIPPEPSIDFRHLAAKVIEFSDNPDLAQLTTERERVDGILFCDRDGYSQAGIGLEQTRDGYMLGLHLPHVNAIAPANSPLDDLMRYSFAYGHNSHRTVNHAWGSHFGIDGSEWPSLTISTPLKIANDGSLQIKRPAIKETVFSPSSVITESTKAEADQPEAELPERLRLLLAVSRRLVEQRVQGGAFEVWHEGKVWARGSSREDLLAPVPNADFIRREVLLTAGIGLGTRLRSERIPALFLTHDRDAQLGPAEISVITELYFSGQMNAYKFWNTIVEARGTPRIEARPHTNNNAYGGPVAPVGSHGRRDRSDYIGIVNARIAEAVATTGQGAYTLDVIEPFAALTRAVHLRRQFTRSEDAVEAGRRGIRRARREREYAERTERTQLPLEELAVLDARSFRTVYEDASRGLVGPEQFSEACSIRVRAKGSMPNSIVLDTLFTARNTELSRVLRNPVLLYIANTPMQAEVIMQNAAAAGLLSEIMLEPNEEGFRASITHEGQKVSAQGSNENDARASALIALASDGRQTIEYYRQHPDAYRWAGGSVNKGVHELVPDGDYLRQLGSLTAAIDRTVIRKARGLTVDVTTMIDGKKYRIQASGGAEDEAMQLAAKRILGMYQRRRR